ncbi:hypothetical protein BGP_1347 [Beggiatoa sp. PS]|nr:hypothetical protein BGP_1347 [Beggiatoa sp. PS]
MLLMKSIDYIKPRFPHFRKGGLGGIFYPLSYYSVGQPNSSPKTLAPSLAMAPPDSPMMIMPY